MSIINSEEALARFDGDEEIYLELIETFLDASLADFVALRAELAEGNVKQVAFRAHKLKGASLTLGGDELARIAGGIEGSLRARFPDEMLAGHKTAALKPGEYVSNVDELERVYNETVLELHRLRDSLQTPR